MALPDAGLIVSLRVDLCTLPTAEGLADTMPDVGEAALGRLTTSSVGAPTGLIAAAGITLEKSPQRQMIHWCFQGVP